MNAILSGLPISSGACLDDEQPISITRPVSAADIPTAVAHLQGMLKAREAKLGGSISVSVCANRLYAVHWFRPDPNAFEDCKSIGEASDAWGLLAQIDGYIRRRAQEQREAHSQVEALGRTLGLEPVHMMAAE